MSGNLLRKVARPTTSDQFLQERKTRVRLDNRSIDRFFDSAVTHS